MHFSEKGGGGVGGLIDRSEIKRADGHVNDDAFSSELRAPLRAAPSRESLEIDLH